MSTLDIKKVKSYEKLMVEGTINNEVAKSKETIQEKDNLVKALKVKKGEFKTNKAKLMELNRKESCEIKKIN